MGRKGMALPAVDAEFALHEDAAPPPSEALLLAFIIHAVTGVLCNLGRLVEACRCQPETGLQRKGLGGVAGGQGMAQGLTHQVPAALPLPQRLVVPGQLHRHLQTLLRVLETDEVLPNLLATTEDQQLRGAVGFGACDGREEAMRRLIVKVEQQVLRATKVWRPQSQKIALRQRHVVLGREGDLLNVHLNKGRLQSSTLALAIPVHVEGAAVL
mmetsp:Transcript_24232/g.57411  ORF Transcript_24232/g.57411 Transcript_24232/m.57411 type:complete len:213 (+) Transcript_24232:282-920(+)